MTTTDTPPASTTPQLDIRNGKATIRLSRPAEHNRLEPIDLRVLTEMFTDLNNNPDARVLIITGTGKSFSSGFHIGALSEDESGSKPEYDPNGFERMVDALENLSIPTIAALNGGVYGGSTDLALACDFRIGVEGMRMFMPAARLGIIYYESGVRRYVSRLGLNNAKRLFMTAEPVEADGMLAMGYLDEIVPKDELDSRVDTLATQIASNAPLAVAGMKQAINAIAHGTFDRAAHDANRARAGSSADHKEGLKAWAEKRKPVFQGR
ncbi:MAG: enoyl-CoA hydratase/isomerase family protein [Hyphomicrobiaceae bacterium]